MGKVAVLIDGLVFENSYQIGIWRIFYEVMQRTASEVDYVLLLEKRPVQLIPDRIKIEHSNHRLICPRRRNLISRILRRNAIRRIERRYSNAIWHSTFFSLDPRRVHRTVLSVYDMISELEIYNTPGFASQAKQKRLCIQQADRFLAISDSTASDLGLLYPDTADRTQTIHPGADHIQRVASVNTSQKNYCLYVGGRFEYKNFLCVVDAMSCQDWPAGLQLMVVGAAFSEEEMCLLKYKGLEDRVHHCGRVSDPQLATLYSESKCVIFPSRIEGFGFPVVEAQQSGAIAVLSDIKVFREIAGEGAEYFNPNYPPSLCAAVRNAIEPSIAARAKENAKANVLRFSWSEAASKTVAAYVDLISTVPISRANLKCAEFST